MRVLLIQPPVDDFYATPIRFYPLGLLYAARQFMRMGCKVSILDGLTPHRKHKRPLPKDFHYLKPFMDAEPLFFQNYYRFGKSIDAVVEAAVDADPDLIGISSQFTAYFNQVETLAGQLKAVRNTPIVIGGHHATVFAKEIKARVPEIDYVLKGPAEASLPLLMKKLTGTNHIDFKPVDWKARSPAHELLAGESYRIGGRPCISLLASRGCPFQCDFCGTAAMFGRRFDPRPPEDALAEITENYHRKHVRIFNFEDDNLLADKNWFTALLTAIIRQADLKDIELTAMNGIGYSRLDTDLLALMKAAGFKRLNLSYVTHDPEIRRKHGRPPSPPNIDRLLAHARQMGFMVTAYVIIGLPDQTREEVRATFDYLLAQEVLVGPSIFYPAPGSALFDQMHLPDSVKDNWRMYRSSAMAVETARLTRKDLCELFVYCRRRNLDQRG